MEDNSVFAVITSVIALLVCTIQCTTNGDVYRSLTQRTEAIEKRVERIENIMLDYKGKEKE